MLSCSHWQKVYETECVISVTQSPHYHLRQMTERRILVVINIENKLTGQWARPNDGKQWRSADNGGIGDTLLIGMIHRVDDPGISVSGNVIFIINNADST